MMYAAAPVSSAPIYYVGQPLAFRASHRPTWSKSSPVISMQTPMHMHPIAPPRKTPSPPPTDVPTAVATLLGLTKQLQEVLRLWALAAADEAQVSDAYVLVGMQFNATCAAFRRHGIDMSELYPIPDDLRAVLEDCLGQAPAPRVLARYMPKVRAVLFRLLQGLQRMQAPYWRAVEREGRASEQGSEGSERGSERGSEQGSERGSERGSWGADEEEWAYARWR